MSRLSWNQIRANAAHFADEWHDASYERGETQSFYNDFFEVFGVRRRKVATFEEPVKKLGGSQGFIDLFWKGVLLVEQKSAGRNLTLAKEQALQYFPGLKDYELPRYILLCDFQSFELYDLDERTTTCFALPDFPQYVEHFGFILGIEKRSFRDQDPVNIQASELMGRLHDALYASGYRGHDLEHLLVRLLFCLFADDTGIFEPVGLFNDLILQRTNDDGSDVGPWLMQLFDVLNEPETERQSNLDEDLNAFPYINGNLFAQRLRVPAFNAQMREIMLEACAFNWDAISPAIFGSLFQSVMNAGQRRAIGAHYTTEKNILKVIEPLFLDELRAEFTRLQARRDNSRRSALEAFHEKLASLRFFDPACGCGNFLIIAYRELRDLEMQLIRELNPAGQLVTDIDALIRVNVHQFYGIEIEEFPARIAEVALWMMDHICNNRMSLAMGQVFLRIPLKTSPHIHNSDALELDWQSVLPAEECSYIMGNPPFIGAKFQTAEQRQQVRDVARLGGSGGTLDYVTAWFLKASDYVAQYDIRIGFVSTNSITQGEQVAQLWPLLFERYGMEICFAHSTFAWGSDARGMAHVHVVVLGLCKRAFEPKSKRLFSYPSIQGDPLESRHGKLSPYLLDASNLANPHVVVREESRPINGLPFLVVGSQPIDGGNMIFAPDEYKEFVKVEPAAEGLIHPFIGADELINGKIRYILALQGTNPHQLRNMPYVMARLERVRGFRAESKRPKTRELAETPALFAFTTIPSGPFMAIPKVSSERREYIPFAYYTPPTIPSDLVFVLNHAEPWHFTLLTSRMHMAWLRAVGGRLKSDYRYSGGMVYNTFPIPELTDESRARLGNLAQAVLDARARYPECSLADLYDTLSMPTELRKAHKALDTAVDRLYRPAPFADDRERVEHLLARYEAMTAGLLTAPAPKRRRAR